MGYSVVCAVLGHRYLYEANASKGPAEPTWVCRRCGDHQDTPPPSHRFAKGQIFLGGWGGA